jgi:hypothetical protein
MLSKTASGIVRCGPVGAFHCRLINTIPGHRKLRNSEFALMRQPCGPASCQKNMVSSKSFQQRSAFVCCPQSFPRPRIERSGKTPPSHPESCLGWLEMSKNARRLVTNVHQSDSCRQGDKIGRFSLSQRGARLRKSRRWSCASCFESAVRLGIGRYRHQFRHSR